MKRVTTYFALAVLVTALSVLAVAGDKKHSARVVFNDDTLVGSTLVEKGEYRVKFNEETGELTIKEMDGDLVVSTKGRVVELGNDAPYTSITTQDTERGRMMVSFQIEGHSKSIVLESNVAVVTEWFEMIFEQ